MFCSEYARCDGVRVRDMQTVHLAHRYIPMNCGNIEELESITYTVRKVRVSKIIIVFAFTNL